MKRISGDSTIVGHIPFEISSICSIFIRRGRSIVSNITGSRRYSSDLEQGGLEIPCTLVFSTGNKEEANKARNRLEATLSIAVAIDTVAIMNSGDTDSIPLNCHASGVSLTFLPAISHCHAQLDNSHALLQI